MRADKLGPEYIIKVYNPRFKIWGYLVIDNIALGPGKGGIRVTPRVSEEEVFRLARVMTFKNALAGIPFGGAKAGIAFDPKKFSLLQKRKIIEWFAKKLKPFVPEFYIAGPDINTGEREMAWFVSAIKNRKGATGKPKKMGGLPHELGNTGFGVVEAAKVALRFKNIPIQSATAAIEGYGNVGTFAHKFLEETGVKIVAVSDSRGTIWNPTGLNYKKLLQTKIKTSSVVNYSGGKKIPGEKIFTLPVDLLIPAAGPDVIHKKNVGAAKAKIIVAAANIPMREEFEEVLYKKGVLVIPDFVANAGGVISSYAEHQGFSEKKMFELVRAKINSSTRKVLALSRELKISPRKAALKLAQDKILRP